ncbi:MAG: DUF5688 family protein [Lachnospiraceae bacterium]|nr:DUF5688 family protein [Lachnospiraceae bacterium]
MMEFTEFTELIAEQILNYLPEKLSDAVAVITQVTKTNDRILHGLLLRRGDNPVAPTLYLEKFYNRYRNEGDLKGILADIAEIIVKNCSNCPVNVDEISDITDFARIKNRIRVKLVDYGSNQAYLADKPYKRVASLAATYYINYQDYDNGNATIAITDAIFDHYDISLEELHDTAVSNTEALMFFSDLDSVLKASCPDEMIPEDADQASSKMYVLSSEDMINGAAMCLSAKVMDQVAEWIGTDFKICPSSQNELILIPSCGHSPEQLQRLKEMVVSINQTEVAPEDKLSDNVFSYDYKTHTLQVAA